MNRVVIWTAALMVAVVGFALMGEEKAEAGLFGGRKCGKPACCEPAPDPCECGGREGLFARMKARKAARKADCCAPEPTCCPEPVCCPAPAPTCCPEPEPCCSAPAPAPCCETAPACGCAAPAPEPCGCAAAPEPCGCEAAPACGCAEAAPAPAPCGCEAAPVVMQTSTVVEGCSTCAGTVVSEGTPVEAAPAAPSEAPAEPAAEDAPEAPAADETT